MTELVRLDTVDAVATITLDSPRNRNALSAALVGELLEQLDSVDADESVKVVVLRAAGPSFCSGADLREAAAGGMREGSARLVTLQRRIATLSQPVLARVHGGVRAGGIGIVAACDLAVAAEDATFAFTEVRLGLAPAAISLSVLPRLTSRAAAEAFLSGEPFDGAQAARIGLVTRAVPPDRLDAAVTEVLGSLLAGSAQGLRETKRLLAEPLVQRIDERGAGLAEWSARLFESPQAQEAMRSFLGRRGR